MTSEAHIDFLARARHEAERYGADAWVLVRELLQNARDAGARSVRFEIEEGRGVDRLACRDDGEGMTFDHARRFLFALYASSKGPGTRAAGRFGIGFWSILRFAPSLITIRSSVTEGRGWEVRLDGELEMIARSMVVMDRGTEVVIERQGRGEPVEKSVCAAILRDAPFLGSLAGEPLEVRVNGKTVRAEPGLPPPSLAFSRRGLRGVVGLGPHPRVEVFAHGLRVRDAASLDDLLLTGRRGRAGVPGVSGGLAPVALMDSTELTVLMARGDAREDRPLRRLVSVGHQELRRLVRKELDRHAGRSFPARVTERAREAWAASKAVRALISAALLILAALSGWRMTGCVGVVDTTASRLAAPPDPRAAPGGNRPFFDLGTRYAGPRADSLTGPSEAIDLEYRPAERIAFFAGLIVAGIGDDGEPLYPPSAERVRINPAPGGGGGFEITLRVDSGTESLRPPNPAGHVPDPSSFRLNGERVSAVGVDGGLAVVELSSGSGGWLSYRCVVGALPGGDRPGRWPRLPPQAAGRAREIASLPSELRAPAVAEYVRRRVRYDASPETADRHRRLEGRGLGLFERSLQIGAGDCDVQNALVAAMLEAAGVRSRLAVGWVGRSGRVAPGLHAWAEYLGGDGLWRVADASAGSASVQPAERDFARPPAEGSGIRLRNVILGGAVAVILTAAGLLLFSIRSERRFTGGDRDSIAGLVRAAAARPTSFAGVDPVFTRPLLPTVGGGRLSLERATGLSADGRLAVGMSGNELAGRAASRGTVLDRGSTEAAVAAEVLGAVDLDEWQELMSGSWSAPTAERVEAALACSGEPCRVRCARSLGEEITVLDGPTVGLDRLDRWVLVDASGKVWRAVRDLCGKAPAAAALRLADAVVERLGMPPELRDRHLAELARAALAERSGTLT